MPLNFASGNGDCAWRRETVFSLESLSFAYEKTKIVLDGVNLAVYHGQCTGICGANGSGKTTLFRCVTGLEKAASGTVWLGDRPMLCEKDFHDLRCKVGYVLQNSEDQLFFPTVLEDLSFGPLNLGLNEAQAAQRAMEALDLVGMAGFENRITHHLSGGEKKLIAIAAILAMKPAALLLDEPLNGLDSSACKKITRIISSLDCARLIISHDAGLLKNAGAEILNLHNGRLEMASV